MAAPKEKGFQTSGRAARCAAPLAAWAAKQKARDDAKRRAGTLRYGVPRADRVGIQ